MWSFSSLLVSVSLISLVATSPIIDRSKLHEKDGIMMLDNYKDYSCPKKHEAMRNPIQVKRGYNQIRESAWVTCSIHNMRSLGQSLVQNPQLAGNIITVIKDSINFDGLSTKELDLLEKLEVETGDPIDFSPQYGGQILVGNFNNEIFRKVPLSMIKNKVVAEWIPQENICIPIGAAWDYINPHPHPKHYKKCLSDDLNFVKTKRSTSSSVYSRYQPQKRNENVSSSQSGSSHNLQQSKPPLEVSSPSDSDPSSMRLYNINPPAPRVDLNPSNSNPSMRLYKSIPPTRSKPKYLDLEDPISSLKSLAKSYSQPPPRADQNPSNFNPSYKSFTPPKRTYLSLSYPIPSSKRLAKSYFPLPPRPNSNPSDSNLPGSYLSTTPPAI